MLARILQRSNVAAPDMLTSKLFSEDTFYPALTKDLKNCSSELIIESPFITNKRLSQLLPSLQMLKSRRVRIAINTRDPHEHAEERWRNEAYQAMATLQHMGVHVLYTDGHHRKLVIIDRKVLYEGSLNVFSQNCSIEVMRRIESVQMAWQMIKFLELDKYF